MKHPNEMLKALNSGPMFEGRATTRLESMSTQSIMEMLIAEVKGESLFKEGDEHGDMILKIALKDGPLQLKSLCETANKSVEVLGNMMIVQYIQLTRYKMLLNDEVLTPRERVGLLQSMIDKYAVDLILNMKGEDVTLEMHIEDIPGGDDPETEI